MLHRTIYVLIGIDNKGQNPWVEAAFDTLEEANQYNEVFNNIYMVDNCIYFDTEIQIDSVEE